MGRDVAAAKIRARISNLSTASTADLVFKLKQSRIEIGAASRTSDCHATPNDTQTLSSHPLFYIRQPKIPPVLVFNSVLVEVRTDIFRGRADRPSARPVVLVFSAVIAQNERCVSQMAFRSLAKRTGS